MKINVRLLTWENFESALEMLSRVFDEYDAECAKEEMQTALDGPLAVMGKHARFLLALHDGKVVAITGYYFLEEHEEDAWLNWTGVLPEYRGRGIGEALVRVAFEHAIQEAPQPVQCFRAWSTLDSECEGARKLYADLGFVEELYEFREPDDATKICIFSKSVNPAKAEALSWKRSAYFLDCQDY